MKILFIAQRVPYPANKGEKIRSYNQIKFLAELGFSIDVVAPFELIEEKEFSDQLSEFNNIYCTALPLPHKLIRLTTGFIKNESLSVANFYSSKLQTKIDQLLSVNNYHAIVCTSSAVAKYLFKSKPLKATKNKPLLLMDFMDLDSDKWRQYSDNSAWPMSWVYSREANLLGEYEKTIQQAFDACFFIAEPEVTLFKKALANNGENIYTLGNGLNTQEFYPAPSLPKNQAPKFIFTGVMDYKPNVDAVIWFVENCWQEIITKYANAEFIIAGMNPNKAINELTKYRGVTITGFVDEILPYYHQADYFVAPFRLARGVQNKVLQAFACGLPVISTPMGAEGINCKNNEHILLANSPTEFISQIERLQNEKGLAEVLRNNALTLIQQNFSWAGKLKPLQDILTNEKQH